MNRRQFIKDGTGILAIAGAASALSGRLALGAGQDSKVNPFAYDVERFSKTDPKLIHFEEAARFASQAVEPRRIAIGPDDRVFVAGRNGIVILGRDGKRRAEIPLDAPARCVAVGADGVIYGGLKEHVEVFSAEGHRIAAWETPGKKTWLTGLAAGPNDVFAADSGNRVVLRYDKRGKLLGRIAEKNKEKGVPGLILPSAYLDVAMGKDGLLRVNNTGRHCVETYTFDGSLELSWGKASAAIDGFCGCCNPIGLALLPDGRCVTAEKGLPRVKVYSAAGVMESVVAGVESFPENSKACASRGLGDCTTGGLHAAVDSEGRIYVLDLVTGDVRVMKRKVT